MIDYDHKPQSFDLSTGYPENSPTNKTLNERGVCQFDFDGKKPTESLPY